MQSRVESKSKKGTALKLNGEWHNANRGVSLDAVNWKDEVEYELNEGGFITSVSVLSSSSGGLATPSTKSTSTGNSSPTVRMEIARGTAVKAVLESPSLAAQLEKVDYSEAVSSVKGLIEEMTGYILSGEFKKTEEAK